MANPHYKANLDVAQVFLTYMATVGDIERTALALDIEPTIVERLAREEKWSEKINRISVTSKSDSPGSFERCQNRALNFVQAHRVRRVLDGVIRWMETHTTGEEGVLQLLDATSSRDKSGRSHFSAKFFVDLTQALEKVHALSYQALGDTSKERVERDEAGKESGGDAGDLHVALISALNSMGDQSAKASHEIVAEASAVAAEIPQGPLLELAPPEEATEEQRAEALNQLGADA